MDSKDFKLAEIYLDSDIIPDKKERLFKEAFQLFRRASNLHDAIHMLELARTPSEKLQNIYTLSIVELIQQRNAIIDEAINRYQLSKKVGV